MQMPFELSTRPVSIPVSINIVIPIPILVNIKCLQVSRLETKSYWNLKFCSRIGIVYNISINCVNIRSVCTVNDLGVYIDVKLNWETLIAYICNKSSRSISILHKANQALNTNAL